MMITFDPNYTPKPGFHYEAQVYRVRFVPDTADLDCTVRQLLLGYGIGTDFYYDNYEDAARCYNRLKINRPRNVYDAIVKTVRPVKDFKAFSMKAISVAHIPINGEHINRDLPLSELYATFSLFGEEWHVMCETGASLPPLK